MKNVQNICVFCGSSMGSNPIYRETAQALGRELALRDIGLVYGGGNIGLMGVVADSVMERGGRVYGVIPQALMERELGHIGITELHIVSTMHERKAKMAEMSQAFIALPGGFGTLDELCEILTWAQLGIHHKPVGLCNVEGFFDSFLAFVERASTERFLRPEHCDLLTVQRDVSSLIEALLSKAEEEPTHLAKWI